MDHALEQMTLLIDSDHLLTRIREMACQIEKDLKGLHGSDPVLVIILKGGFLFGADLLKSLNRPLPVVFVASRSGQGNIFLMPEDQELIRGRTIVVVDTLLDAGGSLRNILNQLELLQPTAIRLAILLHKTVSPAEVIQIDYLGFEVPDVRLVGYGLDEEQRFRGIPAIHTWWAPANVK